MTVNKITELERLGRVETINTNLPKYQIMQKLLFISNQLDSDIRNPHHIWTMNTKTLDWIKEETFNNGISIRFDRNYVYMPGIHQPIKVDDSIPNNVTVIRSKNEQED